jgi:hypothetical protein
MPDLTMKLICRGSPLAFYWEIYRGNAWLERSMHGYQNEIEASRAGQSALQQRINREAAATPISTHPGLRGAHT